MEERFFLDRIEGKGADIIFRNVENAAAVEPDATDPFPPLTNFAPVSAGVAEEFPVGEPLVEFARFGQTLESLLESRFFGCGSQTVHGNSILENHP